ncbi:MAG: lamin tail domain-containing protein [Candidatus Eisenbacteria sp.]|nr:lamin tail domain-containing protein [Candidatus Eisenbacteria bacterium]
MSGRPLSVPFAMVLSVALLCLPAQTQAAAHIADHVVISEVFYEMFPTDTDNFVELYNPTVSAVDLTGWSIVGLDGETGTEYVTVPLSGSIASEGFFLIGPDVYVMGVEPDIVFSGFDLQAGDPDGDGVKLNNNLGQLVDYIAYGGAGNPLVSLEGAPFRDVSANRAIERKSSTTHVEAFGNGEDTDVNADDWRERLSGRPQTGSSATEPPMPYQTEILIITCLNVGQADATLIVSPSGGSFLFDGGNNGAGAGKIVPFLGALGIDTLSYMGASHYDADHIGGLDEVIQQGIAVSGGAWDRGWSYTTATYNSYADAVSGFRYTFYKNQVFDLGSGCTIKCLGLNGNGQLGQPYTAPPWAENDLSVALYLSFYAFQFFVAGDLSGYDDVLYEDIETSMAAEIPQPVEVYQVDHHGSWKSSNLALVNALLPQASVFPVGHSAHGMPHGESMARLNAVGSWLYFTDWVNGDPMPPASTDVEDDVQVATDGFNFFSVDTDIYSFVTDVAEPEIVWPSGGIDVALQPNPVREWTDIRFSVPNPAAPVSVSIYDVAGRRIETQTDDWSGGVSGTLRWSADGHPAGVYFYRIENGDRHRTGKMIVIK